MPLALFAEVEQFRQIAEYMNRDRSNAQFGYLLTAAFAIAIIGLGAHWFERYRKARRLTAPSPQTLFYELCDAHDVSRSDRKLLLRAAPDPAPAQWCSVFVDPRILGRLSLAKSPEADAFTRLAQKLFGDAV